MRNIRNQEDFAAGGLFVALGMTQVVLALDGAAEPAAVRLVPLALGAGLALLGVLLWLKVLAIEVDGGRPARLGPWRAWLAGPVAAAAFALLLPRLGLALAGLGLVLLAALAWSPRERPWAWLGALAPALAVAAIAAWLVPLFPRVAGLPLWPLALVSG